MRRLALLSMHTSPLAQPGTGDGGGLNVYVHQLSSALARQGTLCDVYTRAFSPDVPATVDIEPNLRVHHVAAGPLAPVPKEDLEALVPEFTDAVHTRMTQGHPAGMIHANYWLSGLAGHALKHRLDIPLVCTFHTLARVKAEANDYEPEHRARAESDIIGCSEAVIASCPHEADQLSRLYDADPARVVIIPPGVDHAFFAPGSRAGARRAIGVDPSVPVVLFVGRIQPLKGVDVAVESFAALDHPEALLIVIGGPSGPGGHRYQADICRLSDRLGLGDRIRFVDPQPHELLSSYYRAASVVVVPSRSESFGLVALEASACGTPVVAAAVGGLQTVIDDGRTGLLIPERDPADFAAATSALLADPHLAATMGAAGARRAAAYRWSASATAFQALAAELTDRVLVECR